MAKISKHVSHREGVYSITAQRLGLDNTPNEKQLECMGTIADKIFEPLREFGGSTKSQHCKGQAIDIDDTYGHATNAEMFKWVRENLNFDQMIWEFGNDDNPAWLHISYVNKEDNRNRCLKAYKDEANKTKYMVI